MASAIPDAPPSPRTVLAATKLHIPRLRPGHVARPALIERLASEEPRRLTMLAAPPGFGKTTLLAEWHGSASEARPFAWLSLDEADNDPVRFWNGVIDALGTVLPDIGKDARATLGAHKVAIADLALPLLINELAGIDVDLVLVLDDFHLIREPPAHESIAFLLDHMPPGLQLALATRTDPPLPLSRLRARGELLELRAAQLRLTDAESASLLDNALEAELAPADVARLHERTEGWAAGMYLAALSLRGQDDTSAFIASFAGDERHILDYLSGEVLASQPARLRDFLLRTSVLERLCGPLCDAVTGDQESARTLERLERANLFLVPLDRTRRWYRYHNLFVELLRHELETADPGAAAQLHRRACDWYRQAGPVSDAIHHATAGGDYGVARELIGAHWNECFNQGRVQTVAGWLDRLPAKTVSEDAGLCVARAWLALDQGELEDAERWIGVARSMVAEGLTGAVGTRAEIDVLTAVHGFKTGDLTAARAAGERVLAVGPEAATFASTVAHLMLGVSSYWAGHAAKAQADLRLAAGLAEPDGNDLGRSYALGYLAMVAADRGDPDDARRLGESAIGLSDDPGFSEHFVTMLGHLALGRAAHDSGRLEDAESELGRAEQLSRRGAGRLEAAAALIALAGVLQARGARTQSAELLGRARTNLDASREPGVVAGMLDRAERALRAGRRGTSGRTGAGRDELTERELAVLHLLATDLTRSEIASALYVSPNTIKTQVRAIYRKLNASTRDQVVARARQLGLL